MLTPRDRINVQTHLDDTRHDSRLLHVLIPKFDDVDYDPDTQAGRSISTGDGTGRSVVWKHFACYAHIRPVNSAMLTFGHAPIGAEVGDVFFSIPDRLYGVFREAFANQNAYVLLDRETYHVNSITSAGIGSVEEWTINVRQTHPEYRAAGY